MMEIGEAINGQDQGDQLGYSIALSKDGSILAVGAIRNHDNGENAGQA